MPQRARAIFAAHFLDVVRTPNLLHLLPGKKGACIYAEQRTTTTTTRMRFFPVACFVCCAVASVWTVSRASVWLDGDVWNSATLEALILSRSLVNGYTDITTEYTNMSRSGVDFRLSGYFPTIFDCESATASVEEAADDNPQENFLAANARFAYSLRRETVAFHPIPFDDMYSIDKRGNTLHFVDDATSIAKLGYPILPGLREAFVRPVRRLMRTAIPIAINLAQISN
ncbi:hypothetical protein BV898_04571 [Hypsibius exemplaris]|uniref:Uncharacterized protein n=1 Tax=Hypsibius exemplaris TaxID=2072580 RepID=A0A1W0X222_HYPEX|nr:hypothetical protein BV898_04571 [Hypsibius exemplaris]